MYNKHLLYLFLVVGSIMALITGCSRPSSSTITEHQNTEGIAHKTTQHYSPSKRFIVTTFDELEDGEKNPERFNITIADTKRNSVNNFELVGHSYDFYWNEDSNKLIIQTTVTRQWLTELWLVDLKAMDLKYMMVDIDNIPKAQGFNGGSVLLHNSNLQPIGWKSDQEFLGLYLILDEECSTHYGTFLYDIETEDITVNSNDNMHFFEGALPYNDDAKKLIEQFSE